MLPYWQDLEKLKGLFNTLGFTTKEEGLIKNVEDFIAMVLKGQNKLLDEVSTWGWVSQDYPSKNLGLSMGIS